MPEDKNKPDMAEDFQDESATGSQAADSDSALAAAIAEAEDLRQKLLRWQAYFENLRRRSAREALDSRQNAEGDFARDMLDVLDHFEMALSVDPAKTDSATLLQGVKITYDELKKVLARRGIQSFDPTGQPFDPNLHEAIARENTAEKPPMTVLQTFSKGNKSGDRVLRSARVKVSINPA